MIENKLDTIQSETKQELKFEIQKLYVKELSCRTPAAPQIFHQTGKPEITTEIQIKNEKLEEHTQEVVLRIIVTYKYTNLTALILEVHQAGIFKLENYDATQFEYLLQGYCPNILLPYIRKVISDVIQDAGFTPFTLAPINFELVYQQQLANQQNKKAEDIKNS